MPTDKQKKYTEELYGKITPYLMGPQAKQETIDKAHSIYDIEAEKQQERNNEKGLGRIAPVTAPTSEVKTGAAWLSDYVNSLKKPITPEEEARRERAARAVQGIAGLGNVMTAFSNLAFTGKGAPSQTLPTQQADAMGKEITSWQDKLATEREKYAAAMLGAKTQQWKMEQEAQQRAQMQANEDRRFEYQKKKDDQTRQDKLDENAQAQENWIKQYEQSLKQQDIVNKQNQQRINIAQAQDRRLPKGDNGEKENIEFTLGENETISFEKFNKDKLNRIYRALPENVRESIENETLYDDFGDIKGKKKRSVSDNDRLQAIYENLDNPEVANAIRKIAGVKPAEIEDPNEEKVEDYKSRFASYLERPWSEYANVQDWTPKKK